MNTIMTIIASLAISTATMAQTPIPLSQASMSVSSQTTEVTILKDGTSEEVTDTTYEALNDTGRVHLSLNRVPFRSSVEKVEILKATLITNGIAKEIPVNQLKPTPMAGPKEGLTDLKEFVVPFEGIKIGSKARLIYKKKNLKPSVAGYTESRFVYGYGFPELNSNVKIRSQIPLQYQKADPDQRLLVEQTQKDGWFELSIKMASPIYVVSETQLQSQKVSREEMAKVPRINVATKMNWDELRIQIEKAMSSRTSAPLPPKAAQFLKTIPASESPSNKVARIREWIAENVTYSGRWQDPGSDWIPRSLDEILKSQIGDCKDFASLFVRLAKAAGLPATYTVVLSPRDPISTYMQMPLDQKLPQPSLSYFNHAIAQVKIADKVIYVDPTAPIAQGTTTDYTLYKNFAWVLNNGTQGPQEIEDFSGPESEISTVLTKSIEAFEANSKLSLKGSLATYVNALRFSPNAESVPKILAALAGFPMTEKIMVKKQPAKDRKSSQLDFEITFWPQTNFKTEKDLLQYSHAAAMPFLVLPRVPWAQTISPPNFPHKLRVSTKFPNYFVKDEVKNDCVGFGAFANYTRRSVNSKNQFEIQEYGDFLNSKWSQDDLESSGKTTRLQYHLNDISQCFLNAKYDLDVRDATNKSQIAFEDTIDPDPSHLSEIRTEKFNEDLTKAYRRWATLSERDPKNAWYWFRLGYTIQKMGMINSNIYLPGHLAQARLAIEKGFAIKSDEPFAWAIYGKAQIRDGMDNEAVASFLKTTKLKPEVEAYFLAAEIAEFRKEDEKALGYNKMAEAIATEKHEKKSALMGQITILCKNPIKCFQSESMLDRMVSLDPEDPWNLHNAAIYYSRIEKFEKAIALEKKALNKMDFGVARSTMLAAYMYWISKLVTTDQKTAPDIKKAESLAAEMFAISPNAQQTQWSLYALKTAKAVAEKSPALLDQAEEHLDKLKNTEYTPDQIAFFRNRIQNIRLGLTSGRAPASENEFKGVSNPVFDQLKEKVKKDIETPGGNEFDQKYTQAIAADLKNFIAQCYKASPSDITAVVEIDGQGRISKWDNQFLTASAACLGSKYVGTRREIIPPKGPFSILIEIRLH